MIYIIGIGIEGKFSLSQRALTLIENAGLLIGGRRHLASFPEFKRKKVAIGSNLDEIVKVLTHHSPLTTRHSPVILASGDPNFFGIADFLIKKLGKNAVEIIPNVSAMQAAFAKIKENWNDAKFLSVHGRGKVRSQESGVWSAKDTIDEIVCHNKVGIFTDPDNTPSKIAKALIDRGIHDYMAYVCEDLGTEKERVTEGRLEEIAKKKFSPLNVMALIRQGARGKGQEKILRTPNSKLRTCFGIPDAEFSHQNGMITKEEIRVISLSKLKLRTDSVVWDIGACTGSLSIEAAMLAKNGRVFAVEKEKERIGQIEKNRKKFSAANLEIICRKAPDGLKDLPVPDAVFIGGGGADIGKILDTCSRRIKNSGRIVVNAITLETLKRAADFFKKIDWNTETISVNIARTKDVAGLQLFNAYNPVFIIVGEKP